MTKTVLQIESIEATELISRLDRMESAIGALAGATPAPNQTPDTLAGYITRREVAKLFKISLVTVHDWTRKGLLSAYKIGNRVYYKRAEVEGALTKKGGLYGIR